MTDKQKWQEVVKEMHECCEPHVSLMMDKSVLKEFDEENNLITVMFPQELYSFHKYLTDSLPSWGPCVLKSFGRVKLDLSFEKIEFNKSKNNVEA